MPYYSKPASPTTELDASLPSLFTAESEDSKALEERIFGLIGREGRYQRLLLLFQVCAMMVLGLHNVLYVVIARSVDHWCQLPELPREQNLSEEEWKRVLLPAAPDGSLSQCFMYDPRHPPTPTNETRPEIPCDAWHYNSSHIGVTIIEEVRGIPCLWISGKERPGDRECTCRFPCNTFCPIIAHKNDCNQCGLSKLGDVPHLCRMEVHTIGIVQKTKMYQVEAQLLCA